jgi:hypothetical protein
MRREDVITIKINRETQARLKALAAANCMKITLLADRIINDWLDARQGDDHPYFLNSQ